MVLWIRTGSITGGNAYIIVDIGKGVRFRFDLHVLCIQREG